MQSSETLSTQEKIKAAAREVFIKKGYAAAKTRHIADVAGINLALLNYYFRSKEKLFHIIIMETLAELFDTFEAIIKNPETSIPDKVRLMVTAYLDTLVVQPDIPLFIINEVNRNPKLVIQDLKINERIQSEHFIQQWSAFAAKNGIPTQHFIHILVNTVSMTVFPFLAKPVLSEVFGIKDQDFVDFVNQRKQLIPTWFDVIVQSYKQKPL